ncbi:hypothetical protein M440DRAFT_1023828 [Trichoderma longibrachiatum ATCC 18648]|uniref:Uncharacterized protein n=1 Tax=Trichoderma longibrachiatum ATCC 18648 TaxID=983965 RepID=A0A2T4CJR7_TRILO|nr:hypothetical protein M440DRAFT_1023828 [Trichoderma longibrachiatum ATCC 18648]
MMVGAGEVSSRLHGGSRRTEKKEKDTLDGMRAIGTRSSPHFLHLVFIPRLRLLPCVPFCRVTAGIRILGVFLRDAAGLQCRFLHGRAGLSLAQQALQRARGSRAGPAGGRGARHRVNRDVAVPGPCSLGQGGQGKGCSLFHRHADVEMAFRIDGGLR